MYEKDDDEARAVRYDDKKKATGEFVLGSNLLV